MVVLCRAGGRQITAGLAQGEVGMTTDKDWEAIRKSATIGGLMLDNYLLLESMRKIVRVAGRCPGDDSLEGTTIERVRHIAQSALDNMEMES